MDNSEKPARKLSVKITNLHTGESKTITGTPEEFKARTEERTRALIEHLTGPARLRAALDRMTAPTRIIQQQNAALRAVLDHITAPYRIISAPFARLLENIALLRRLRPVPGTIGQLYDTAQRIAQQQKELAELKAENPALYDELFPIEKTGSHSREAREIDGLKASKTVLALVCVYAGFYDRRSVAGFLSKAFESESPPEYYLKDVPKVRNQYTRKKGFTDLPPSSTAKKKAARLEMLLDCSEWLQKLNLPGKRVLRQDINALHEQLKQPKR